MENQNQNYPRTRREGKVRRAKRGEGVVGYPSLRRRGHGTSHRGESLFIVFVAPLGLSCFHLELLLAQLTLQPILLSYQLFEFELISCQSQPLVVQFFPSWTPLEISMWQKIRASMKIQIFKDKISPFWAWTGVWAPSLWTSNMCGFSLVASWLAFPSLAHLLILFSF